MIEFPVATYYASKKREGSPSDRDLRDEELIVLIRQVWEGKGKRLYGSRKVWKQLRRGWCGRGAVHSGAVDARRRYAWRDGAQPQASDHCAWRRVP